MQAMILAAGFGTRLLPYTKIRPKPLFPLLNIPLLFLTVERLKADGFSHIIINCHHLREQVVELLSHIDGVHLQQEEQILGTGGGLRQAMESMRDEPLLIINGDIYHTIDLRKLYSDHAGSGAAVTLAVHDYPRFNTLRVERGRPVGFGGEKTPGSLAFTGVHVIEPQILEPISPGQKSCIIDRYRDVMEEGRKTINLLRVDDCFWTDMGTVPDYLDLHRGLLLKEIPALPQLQSRCHQPFYIDDHAECGAGMRLDGWASIGRAKIGSKVTLVRSVVWDGAVIPDNSYIEDAIVAS